MNEINIKEIQQQNEAKINKIRTLTIYLMDLEKMSQSELLNKEAREACLLIIKEVMAKLSEVNK